MDRATIIEKACEGGRTLTATRGGTDFEECLACGRAVRWDLTEHRLFGFQHCPDKSRAVDAVAKGDEVL